MDLSAIDKRVRKCIEKDQTREAIDLLSSLFNDNLYQDEITILLAQFNSVREKDISRTISGAELDLRLNNIRLNVLKILNSKIEYYTYKEQTFGRNSFSETTKGDGLIRVFFSVANPFNDAQQNYIDELARFFKERGILLDTLTEWDDKDPLVPIMNQMKNASGCLVLALERYHVIEGVEKRGSLQEISLKGKSYTSPWLHIEATAARLFNLPLITLKEKSLINDGVIHDDLKAWNVVRINQSNINEIYEYPIDRFILDWIEKVKAFKPSHQG